MAETFLTPVIGMVRLLIEEVKPLKDVHKEAKNLEDELEIIQPFLRDADERSSERGETSDAVRAWVRQIREEVDRIADVIDCFSLYDRRRRSSVGPLRRVGRLVQSFKARYDVAAEIREINESLGKIKDRAGRYGLRALEQGSASNRRYDPRVVSHFIEENELLDVGAPSEELKRSLIEGGDTRSVISLVGEGGIGKTTLAKKVYGSEAVRGHFDCRAWVTVSQSYELEKLLMVMARQMIRPAEERSSWETYTAEELIDHLRQHLKEKRYVVVFDDVWQSDFWDEMKQAVPVNENGSRIIVTTRSFTVADACKETPFDVVQKLQTWSPEMAWDLFCKKAFRYEPVRHCPPELEQLSREIVNKCQGLPLVIATVAGLLSTKEKVEFEWRKVLHNLAFEFGRNPEFTRISKTLSLGYYDLPYHLVACFLYFGVFPEDYSIPDEKLYKLWIAEGFIGEKVNQTPERVAEEYLNELINRNLVAFEEFDGIVRDCRVHDLMHEIILSKAEESGFCRILDEKKASNFRGKSSRRLSIRGSAGNVFETAQNHGIRAVSFLNVKKLTESFMATFFARFKLLRILDYEHFHLTRLPKEVGNLFHLKYLSFRNANLESLPKSIGKLQNLQTLCLAYTMVNKLPSSIGELFNLQALDVRCNMICELPKQINKLRNLRHILVNVFIGDDTVIRHTLNGFEGVKLHKGICHLKNLEALLLVDASASGMDVICELENLVKLTSLGVSKLTVEMGSAVCFSVEKMKELEHLSITSTSEHEVLDLKYISSPPPRIKCLRLGGRLNNLFEWIPKLYNLRQLHLSFSHLVDDPLQGLKTLPKLASLVLYDAYDGKKLHFEKDGFVKLKELHLRRMRRLKAVEIDEGALPLLEDLRIEFIPLEEEPSGLRHLGNLKHLNIISTSVKVFTSTPSCKADRESYRTKYFEIMRVQSFHHMMIPS